MARELINSHVQNIFFFKCGIRKMQENAYSILIKTAISKVISKHKTVIAKQREIIC